MRLALCSLKGGVGKTSLAFSLAKDLDYRYVTNDLSLIIQKYSKAKFFPKKIPLYEDTIYDFGGFDSSYVNDILFDMDLIIIPTINDINSMFKTLEVLRKVKGQKVIVVANVVEKQKDFDDIKLVVNHYYKNVIVTYFRKSVLLKNAIEENKSARLLFNENKSHKNPYKDYENILNFVEKNYIQHLKPIEAKSIRTMDKKDKDRINKRATLIN